MLVAFPNRKFCYADNAVILIFTSYFITFRAVFLLPEWNPPQTVQFLATMIKHIVFLTGFLCFR